jgi:large subunit ribosomal protein LP0
MTLCISAEKEMYAERFNRLIDTYSKILFCTIDNVRSQQLHGIRASLRGKGEMIVGKKTLQKKILSMRAESENATDNDKLLCENLVEENMLVGNLALVFTNEDVSVIQAILTNHKIQAPAKIGAISPVDVEILAGNTGLEPNATSFFQALNINTKIARGSVEILADKKVLSVGDKVDTSTSQLLKKLKIAPFWYAAEVNFSFERGLIFTAADLALTESVIEQSILAAIGDLTAISLATGVLTEASFPAAIVDGFKNLLGASVATDYVFDAFGGKDLKENILA